MNLIYVCSYKPAHRKRSTVYNEAVKLQDELTGSEYIVITVQTPNNGKSVAIMDAEYYSNEDPSIYVQNNGYAYMHIEDHKCVTHHSTIMKKGKDENIDDGLSIDHINWQKNDNRMANMRYTTQSVQNTNRDTRCDKLLPHEDLRNLGIEILPRRMRWDKTEDKFVIELPTTTISGTKSQKVSTINKFRNCLEKYMTYLETNADVSDVSEKIKLANEYNDIVKAAHKAAPYIFPDGPYCNINKLNDIYQYCEECMNKLPPVGQDEALHGYLNLPQDFKYNEDYDAIILMKISKEKNCKLIFDSKYADIVIELPKVDMSTTTPCIPSVWKLYEMFPGIVSNEDVQIKKKYLVKDLVWRGFLKKEIPDGYVVVPINGQTYDFREDNLQILEGTSKNFKSLEAIPFFPENCTLKTMNFLPKNVSIDYASKSARNPWTLFVKMPNGASRKSFLCSSENITTTIIDKVSKLLPNFEEENTKYQKLLYEYCQMMEINVPNI